MKNLFLGLVFFVLLVACASNETKSSNTSSANIGKQFSFSGVEFNFSQKVSPKLTYHSPAELEALANEKIKALLTKKGYLAKQATANELKIKLDYVRRFVGDATAAPSSSLAYPELGYQIDILDTNKKVIKTLKKDNQAYKGGFAMNLKVIAGGLKDKKHEITFVEALANTVVGAVGKMRR